MGLDQLAQLGEFISGIAVVVSLVYVAHQVHRSTTSQQTENYARVLDRMSTLQSRLAADAELHRIFVVGAEAPGRLKRSERLRFAWALYELFGAGEFMYHQARDNRLPGVVWARWEATMVWWLSHPGMRAWWANKPTPLSADFEEFVEDIIRARRVDPETLARWHGFVAGDALASGPAPPGRVPVS